MKTNVFYTTQQVCGGLFVCNTYPTVLKNGTHVVTASDADDTSGVRLQLAWCALWLLCSLLLWVVVVVVLADACVYGEAFSQHKHRSVSCCSSCTWQSKRALIAP